MALNKNPRYDLKRKYSRVLEISIILSLLILIAAFKFAPDYCYEKTNNYAFRGTCRGDHIIQSIPSTNQAKLPLLPDPTLYDPHGRTSRETDVLAEDDEQNQPVCIWTPPDKFPDLIGGIKSLQDKIEYPDSARKNNIQGMVIATAEVDEEGNVMDVELRKGIGWGCDDEALRVLREAKFTPAIHMGKPVKTKITVPIRFRIDENGKAHNQ